MFLIAACLVLAVSLAWANSTITIKGSDTMVILGQRWAEHYMKTHKDVVLQVTGGGSGTGIAALINGTADIAQASRPMKAKEQDMMLEKRGVRAYEIATALDGLAIYVHESNPIKQLTLDQLKQIYQNDVTNWSEVGGPDQDIVIYSRENNSGTYAYFKEHVLNNEDFSAYAQTLPGTAAVINAVSKDPSSIGYGGIGYSEGVRVVPVAVDAESEAYLPTEENVNAMIYPLARSLYWYTAGEPTGDTKALIDWVLGPEGQKLVTEVGYYPLPTGDKAETTGASNEDAKSMKAEK
ncbi:MAG: phosphate ABC transporter substrate-binding protein [Candidatus Zixiibacteriota bacterium]